MALAGIDWSPRSEQLRQFALVAAAFALLLACWLWRREAPPAAVWTLITLGAGIGLLGGLWPDSVRYLYTATMLITYPIGWLVSQLVLGAIYFGVFTPIALVFRLLGRDALQRRFEPEASTYWQSRPPAPEPGRYLRQF
jgi:hypothetical protein